MLRIQNFLQMRNFVSTRVVFSQQPRWIAASSLMRLFNDFITQHHLLVGLKMHKVSDGIFRLTWSNGIIQGEGTIDQLHQNLTDLGFEVNMNLMGVSNNFAYIEGDNNANTNPGAEKPLRFTNSGGGISTVVCEFQCFWVGITTMTCLNLA